MISKDYTPPAKKSTLVRSHTKNSVSQGMTMSKNTRAFIEARVKSILHRFVKRLSLDAKINGNMKNVMDVIITKTSTKSLMYTDYLGLLYGKERGMPARSTTFEYLKKAEALGVIKRHKTNNPFDKVVIEVIPDEQAMQELQALHNEYKSGVPCPISGHNSITTPKPLTTDEKENIQYSFLLRQASEKGMLKQEPNPILEVGWS